MRVVYVSPSGGLGGAERVLLTVLAAVRKADPPVRPHLISMEDGPLLEEAGRLGADVTLLPAPERLRNSGDSALRSKGLIGKIRGLAGMAISGLPQVWGYAQRLRRAVTAVKPDLIHSNGIKSHLLTCLLPPPAPVLWHLHDFYGSRPAAGYLLRRLHSRAAGAVAISQAVRRDARTLFPRLPIRTVLNAVDTEEFAPSGSRDGEWLDGLAGFSPPASVRVGLVATYARWKGQEIFLRAAANLKQRCLEENIKFYVIGGPIYRTSGSQFTKHELEKKTEEFGLKEVVGFIGFQYKTVRVYNALDVVVHASTEPEPFGLTIAEAMACGRPVVASKCGGAAEIIVNPNAAVGANPGDPDSFAGAIERLAADPRARELIGAAARCEALKRFSRERLTSQFGQVYHEFVRAESRPRVGRGGGRRGGT